MSATTTVTFRAYGKADAFIRAFHSHFGRAGEPNVMNASYFRLSVPGRIPADEFNAFAIGYSAGNGKLAERVVFVSAKEGER